MSKTHRELEKELNLDNEELNRGYKKLNLDVIDIMRSNDTLERREGFYYGNVMKYISRDKDSKLEDLKKARDYLNFWIDDVGDGD